MARDHLVDHERREFLRIAANSTALLALAAGGGLPLVSDGGRARRSRGAKRSRHSRRDGSGRSARSRGGARSVSARRDERLCARPAQSRSGVRRWSSDAARSAARLSATASPLAGRRIRLCGTRQHRVATGSCRKSLSLRSKRQVSLRNPGPRQPRSRRRRNGDTALGQPIAKWRAAELGGPD